MLQIILHCKTASYSLPKWKRIPQLDSKGKNGAKDTMTAVILDTSAKDIKELLLKVKIDVSYEVNFKTLSSHDVKLLHETLKYLGVETDGLIKEGVCYNILKKLYSLMPYSCEGCMRDIDISAEPGENKCVGCGTHLCSKCTSRDNSVCHPCIQWIKDRFRVPEEFFKKSYLKNKEK